MTMHAIQDDDSLICCFSCHKKIELHEEHVMLTSRNVLYLKRLRTITYCLECFKANAAHNVIDYITKRDPSLGEPKRFEDLLPIDQEVVKLDGLTNGIYEYHSIELGKPHGSWWSKQWQCPMCHIFMSYGHRKEAESNGEYKCWSCSSSHKIVEVVV